MKIIFLSISFLYISISSIAQEFNSKKLSEYISKWAKENHFMGAITISKDDTIIYNHSIGYANIESSRSLNDSSVFGIGSISKTFTATLIIKATELKLLNFNQTIDKYFPEIQNANLITIEHLLQHRSGIYNYTNFKDYSSWSYEPIQRIDMVKKIANTKPRFQPGTKHEYSNSNYALLTYILEEVFKQTYSEILTQYIIKPLNLTNTYFGWNQVPTTNKCFSYMYKKDWIQKKNTNPSVSLGAGGIYSTTTDLIIFSNALFNKQIISDSNLTLMTTLVDGYGYGIGTTTDLNKLGFCHTGLIDGFISGFAHYEDENISIAVTSNSSSYNFNDIFMASLKETYNIPYEQINTKYSVSPKKLETYIGKYTSTEASKDITITSNGIVLLLVDNQNNFTYSFTPIKKNIFESSTPNTTITFSKNNHIITFLQGAETIQFMKN